MTKASDYLETSILNHFFRNSSVTSPTTVYAALYTAAPSDAGGGTEVSGNGYARQAITFAAPSSGSSATNADVSFTASGGDWGTITHWGIFDALTGGNLLVWDAASLNQTIADGQTFKWSSGNLTLTVD